MSKEIVYQSKNWTGYHFTGGGILAYGAVFNESRKHIHFFETEGLMIRWLKKADSVDCFHCDRMKCPHRYFDRRYPIKYGGKGLCPKLHEESEET